MTRALAFRMAVPVTVVGLIIAAALVVLVVAVDGQRTSTQLARRTERAIATAYAAQGLLVDAQTGARGYAVAHRDPFLDPWRHARQAFPGVADDLVAQVTRTGTGTEIARRIRTDGLAYLRHADALVARLRSDPAAGRALIASGAGKRQLDALRADFGRLVGQAQSRSDARTAAARAAGSRATVMAIAAVAIAVLLLAALVAYLRRAVALPVRRVASAAERLGAGDLRARVAERGRDEIGRLGSAFNAMASALEENATELESQNAELEAQAAEMEAQAVELETQTAELESSQHELAIANDELRGKQAELESTIASLAEANERIGLFAQVVDGFARHPSIEDRATTALAAVADLVGADVGALYACVPADAGGSADESELTLLAARGLRADEVARATAGLPSRALLERRPVSAAHPEGGLRLEGFGRPVAIRQELHVPLLYGSRALGAISLGRIGDRPFSHDEIGTIQQLCEHTAVALENALVTRRAQRLADLNRAVLDATRDAIALLDRDGRTLIANPAMERAAADVLRIPLDVPLTGEAATEAIAERTADPAAYRERMVAILGDPSAEGVDEIEIVDVGRWLHRYVAPVHGADGELQGRIVVLRDTTEQHEAERMKDELMATVSHELRTPLAAILGFTELLLVRDFSAEDRAAHTRTIHAQAKRLSMLIDDFLDLQRLEEGGLTLTPEPVDVRALLEEQVALYDAQSQEHDVELRCGRGPLVARGEAQSLARAVANLLSNAIKYSPDGGPVTVDAVRQNGEIAISVSDRGVGIPASARERVFERFFRVDSSATRSIGGTGLGLSLVREIVAAHGGRVSFESIEGEGTTFSVRLPAVDGS